MPIAARTPTQRRITSQVPMTPILSDSFRTGALHTPQKPIAGARSRSSHSPSDRSFPVERGTQEHAASLYFSRASVHRAVRQLLHGLTGSRAKSYKSITAALLTACPAHRGLLSTSRSRGGGHNSLTAIPGHREIIGSRLGAAGVHLSPNAPGNHRVPVRYRWAPFEPQPTRESLGHAWATLGSI